MDEGIRTYLATIGRKGGKISRRSLDSDTAGSMVRIREARRAFRKFHAMCFWSSPVDFTITERDVNWVSQSLKKHGNMEAWKVAERLCR